MIYYVKQPLLSKQGKKEVKNRESRKVKWMQLFNPGYLFSVPNEKNILAFF